MARGKKKEAALSSEERLQAALVPESERPYKVPENWCWAKGSAFLKPMETRRPEGEKFRYIDIDSIDNQRQKVTEPKVLFVKDAPSRASRKLRTGDTIFSMVRPYLMNIAYIDETISDSIASTGFYVCTPARNINPRYLYYLMISPYTVEGLNQYMKGDNSPSIRKDDIEGYPYPIPTLPEQQRIVNRIENLFTKLDEAKQKAQDALDSFETRKAAILHRAFTGELTAQWRKEHGVGMESWDNKTLSQISKEIKAGGDKPDDFTEKSDEIHNIPVVANGITDEGIIGYTASARFEGETVTVAGRGTIGFSVYRTYPFFPVVRLIVIKPYDFVNAAYIKYSFDAFPESGTGSNIPQLTVPMVKQKEIPLPEINEQTEIVRILDNLLAKEQQAKEAAEKVLEQIDLTKKAILARAFRGELGTNDPSEESAIKLLEQSFSEAIEDKKVKHKQGSKQKEEVVFMPKTIMEALSTGARLTPENLKRQTELSIDDFYAQLKNLIDNGSVIESRENGESYLEAANEDRQAENQQL